ARSSFGKITVAQVRKGARLVGNNSAVSVADVSGGPVSVSTSFGLVEATRIDGDLKVDNSNGAVRVSGVKGSARISTSFAAASGEGVGGSVDVDNQNGSVEVRGLSAAARCAPVTIKSSFGPIRVFLPEGTGYDVSARTSFGKVTTQIPMSVSGSVSS